MKILTETIASDSPPQRLDRVVQRLTGLSRAAVRGVLDHGCVTVNNSQAALPQTTLTAGDVVRIDFHPQRRYKERPPALADPAYQILHEDDHLIVVHKAAHVLTVPTASGKGKTLIEALQRHINHGKPSKLHKRLHVVHRLDQGVSGVVVVAKTASIAEKLKDQFASHKPQRIYIAIVSGRMEEPRGTFRSYLITDYALNRRSTAKPGKGELAITHYEVIGGSRNKTRPKSKSTAATPLAPGSAGGKGADSNRQSTYDFTVVRVQLETGRRNQIRVHFSEAGYPVLGDPRYPVTPSPERAESNVVSSSHPHWRAKRLALHAASLEFTHPATGELLRFEAQLPDEFRSFC